MSGTHEARRSEDSSNKRARLPPTSDEDRHVPGHRKKRAALTVYAPPVHAVDYFAVELHALFSLGEKPGADQPLCCSTARSDSIVVALKNELHLLSGLSEHLLRPYCGGIVHEELEADVAALASVWVGGVELLAVCDTLGRLRVLDMDAWAREGTISAPAVVLATERVEEASPVLQLEWAPTEGSTSGYLYGLLACGDIVVFSIRLMGLGEGGGVQLRRFGLPPVAEKVVAERSDEERDGAGTDCLMCVSSFTGALFTCTAPLAPEAQSYMRLWQGAQACNDGAGTNLGPTLISGRRFPSGLLPSQMRPFAAEFVAEDVLALFASDPEAAEPSTLAVWCVVEPIGGTSSSCWCSPVGYTALPLAPRACNPRLCGDDLYLGLTRGWFARIGVSKCVAYVRAACRPVPRPFGIMELEYDTTVCLGLPESVGQLSGFHMCGTGDHAAVLGHGAVFVAARRAHSPASAGNEALFRGESAPVVAKSAEGAMSSSQVGERLACITDMLRTQAGWIPSINEALQQQYEHSQAVLRRLSALEGREETQRALLEKWGTTEKELEMQRDALLAADRVQERLEVVQDRLRESHEITVAQGAQISALLEENARYAQANEELQGKLHVAGSHDNEVSARVEALAAELKSIREERDKWKRTAENRLQRSVLSTATPKAMITLNKGSSPLKEGRTPSRTPSRIFPLEPSLLQAKGSTNMSPFLKAAATRTISDKLPSDQNSTPRKSAFASLFGGA